MKNKRIVIAVVLSVTLVAFLLTQISLGDISETFKRIDPFYILAGFALYATSYVFRALRFRLLLNQKGDFKDTYSIVCVHNMANSVLPARTGELSYIYLANRVNAIELGEAVATLLAARVFDFIAISSVFLMSAALVKNAPEPTTLIVTIVAVGLLLTVILLLTLVLKGKSLSTRLDRMVTKLNMRHFRIVKFVLFEGHKAAEIFETIKSSRIVSRVLAYTFLVWFANYLMTYLIVHQMGMDVSVPELFLGVTLIVFLTLLPIPTILGLGVHEGVWALVFVSFGVSQELALATGFTYHILIICFNVFLGLGGLIMLNKRTLP